MLMNNLNINNNNNMDNNNNNGNNNMFNQNNNQNNNRNNPDGQETVIMVKFVELGKRLDEAIRGKELLLTTSDVDLMVSNLLSDNIATNNMDGRLIGASNSNGIANIVNGWETSRFMITVISERKLGFGGRLITVLQSFTDDTDVVNQGFNGGGTTYNFQAKLNINRVSQFKDNGNGVLVPYKAMNIIANRWEGSNDGTNEELVKMRPMDIHNFTNIQGITDVRWEYNSTAGTSNISNGGKHFVDKLTNSCLVGSRAKLANESNGGGISGRVVAEAGMGNIQIIRDYMTSGSSIQDRVNRTNPSYITLDYVNSKTKNGLDNISTIVFNNRDNDTTMMNTSKFMTQNTTTGNGLEVKSNVELAEVVGDICMNYDIESLLVSFFTVMPTAQNGYANYLPDANTIISGFVVPNIDIHTQQNRTNLALTEIGLELQRIYGGFSFSVSIEMLGGTSIEIKTSLEGTHGVATMHNYFANSTYNSIITNKNNMSNVVMTTNNFENELTRTLGDLSQEEMKKSNTFNDNNSMNNPMNNNQNNNNQNNQNNNNQNNNNGGGMKTTFGSASGMM